MGQPKQLLPFQGKTLLRHTVDVAIASTCDSVVVVLGACADRISPELEQLPVAIVKNPAWSEGMGTSIGTGIQFLQKTSPGINAAVITVCDQPFLSTQFVDHLVATYFASGAAIIAAQYSQSQGVPALFCDRIFPDLIKLRQTGAKSIIQRYADEVQAVPFPNGMLDIDTPTDYEKLVKIAA